MDIFNNRDVTHVVEFVKRKFYFATSRFQRGLIRDNPSTHFFTTDNLLVYKNFYNDFGPLNLGCLYRYCVLVNDKLSNPRFKKKRIVHFTSSDDNKRANAVFLVASYAVIYLQKAPEEVYHLLTSPSLPPLKSFQDASLKFSNYTINLLDCLHAIFKALFYGFVNFNDFDVAEYERLAELRYGDLHWVVPQKFIAFLGPSTENRSPYQPPECYVNYFLQNNVVAVVRLNRITYPAYRFVNYGIDHYDMFIPDGSTPEHSQLMQFLHLAETSNGAIAVHCKAGLGRTGSLIAAYIMKHYKMTAKEAIAWLRICRPGCVIGHQQTWLEKIEKSLWQLGDGHRKRLFQDKDKIQHHEKGVYSKSFSTPGKERPWQSRVLRPVNNNSLFMQMERSLSTPQNMTQFGMTPGSSSPTQGDRLNEIKFKQWRNQHYLFNSK